MPPNGMSPAPFGDLGWRNLSSIDDRGQPTSFHAIPLEQFVHAVDMEVTCACGPSVSYIHIPQRTVPFAHHIALDVRYYQDWHEGHDEGEPPEPDNSPLG